MFRFSNSENVGGFMNRATAWWRPRGKWCNPVCAADAPLMEPLTRMVASLMGMRKMNSMFTCRPYPASQYVVLGCRIHSWMFVGFLFLQYLFVLLGALTRNYTKFPMLFNWLDWRHRQSMSRRKILAFFDAFNLLFRKRNMMISILFSNHKT